MTSPDYSRTNYKFQAWSKYAEWSANHPNINDTKTFDMFMRKLVDRESFHVARYNDGEWVFMLEIPPHFENLINRNGHNIDQVREVAAKLNAIFDSYPDYYIGVDSTTRAGRGLVQRVNNKVIEKIDSVKNIIYGDIFNAATIKNGISYFTDNLKDRVVITVGPRHLRQLNIAKTHIAVPENNCWVQTNSVEYLVNQKIKENLHNHPVIIYSCSLLAKLLVDVFYHQYGDKITQMDVGSCLDPWCGVFSRPWHTDIITYYNRYMRAKIDANKHASYSTEAEQALKDNTGYTEK